MSVDQVSICNSALINVGADRISALTQNTRSAILLNSVYDLIRDEVQSAHPWNFTLNRRTLTPNSDEPAHGYDFIIDLPNDYLTLWEVIPHDIDYVVENKKVLTNETSLDLVYGARNTDESSWDALFAEAFAWRLSTKVSYGLTQSMPLMETCDRKYKEILSQARWRDGIEGKLLTLEADTWTLARR